MTNSRSSFSIPIDDEQYRRSIIQSAVSESKKNKVRRQSGHYLLLPQSLARHKKLPVPRPVMVASLLSAISWRKLEKIWRRRRRRGRTCLWKVCIDQLSMPGLGPHPKDLLLRVILRQSTPCRAGPSNQSSEMKEEVAKEELREDLPGRMDQQWRRQSWT